MKIIIKDSRYIPFLNTVGPILTPVKVPEEIYNRLVSGGIKVEVVGNHIPTVAKAKEVVKVVEQPKEEVKAIKFEDLAAKPQETIVVEPQAIEEEVVEEIVEEVEYVEEIVEEEVEYVEEIVEEEVEEEKPASNSKKKKKK